MKLVKFSFLILTTLTLFACGSSNTSTASKAEKAPSEAELATGYWELVRMAEMPAIKTPMDGDRKIGMSFNTSENRINGYSGCNNFFGSYVLNGSAVTFSQMGSTKMACVRNVIDEQVFLTMFSQANKIILEDRLLKLMDSNNIVLAVFQHTANDGMAKPDAAEE